MSSGWRMGPRDRALDEPATQRVLPREEKHARAEYERRFLLDRLPAGVHVAQSRRITDRYIDGTSLRLRKQSDPDGFTRFKLTQKVRRPADESLRIMVTTLYVSRPEFDLLSRLPASVLRKARYSVPPLGIDVFEGILKGLVLAEAEFSSSEEANALVAPSFTGCEVSFDERFTGGRLVHATRLELRSWLAEYGIRLQNV